MGKNPAPNAKGNAMKILNLSLALLVGCLAACSPATDPSQPLDFQYQGDRFADIQILRYRVPGFEELTVKQRELLYYLYQAALSGRDIIWDQNYRHNLYLRRTLENIFANYRGDRNSQQWEQFMVYTKRIWFSSGLHHHYSSLKIMPEFSREYFGRLVKDSDQNGFPLQGSETVDDLLAKLTPIMFDPDVAPKKINLNPEVDQIKESATNYYGQELTQKEVERFYSSLIGEDDPQPVSYGLNSKLVKENGKVQEKVWRVGDMYGTAIEKIVYWLEKAGQVAETTEQRASLQKLSQYLETGDLNTFDEHNILWVSDTDSTVDVINGFIEVYGDPLGFKGAFESVVFFKDQEATQRIEALSRNAQWFEDHSPTLKPHKRENVTGISARVVTVVVGSGDASPSSPIGINLPNPDWIRKEHGSKSVNLGNIVYAYEQWAKSSGSLEEFAYSQEEIERSEEHGILAGHLTTDMHEVIGHASGQIEPGVGTTKETLKSYASALEEARADLVALYYLMDPKLVEIGVMPSLEVGRAGYAGYIRGGLMVQLARLKAGEGLEEAHMRNRHMVCRWVYEKGRSESVIEMKIRDGKTYYVINDYQRLRDLFGELLREIQRIKSTGDYQAGRDLVERYGIKVDPELHKEILERYARLNRAPYAGFINPILVPVTNENGDIVDIEIEYPDDFAQQMMDYGKNCSFLPTYN